MSPRLALRLEHVVAGLALTILAGVALVRQGEEVARGYLLPTFDSYEVARVRLLGIELYVDHSAGFEDVLSAGALAGAGAMLLRAAVFLEPAARRAFRTAGWGALFLAGDDLLSAHETIGHNLPVLARLPLVDHSDDVVLAVYALVAGAFLWRHRALAAGSDRRPWMVAGAAAGVALVHDLLPLHFGRLEEGLEMLAAVSVAIAVAQLARRLRAARDPVAGGGVDRAVA